MENNNMLAKTLAQYGEEGLWVAFSENKEQVAGKGKTLKEALAQAKENNVENPVVIKATPDYSNSQYKAKLQRKRVYCPLPY